MRPILCLILVLAAGVFVRVIDAASRPAALPFTLTNKGAIIVPVSVDGSRAVFVLDTGSNGSVISDSLAASLGLRAVARTTLSSASSAREATVARIGHLAFGPVGADSVLATQVPAAHLRLRDCDGLDCRIDGVIGQDALSRLRYTIDYAARRIDWRESPADPPAHASRFALELQDDRFLVTLPQADRALRLVPDSGSETLVLFPHGGAPPAAVRAMGPVGVTGVVGTRAAQLAVVPALRVGDATLTDVPAVIVDGADARPDVDGLLPLHLFARVTFDGPDRQLFIERR